ncbi:MAG: hypothetical protein GVY24_01995 [Planctomycetes bacterium]|jgi:ankyrin repeat protein|nr:hypothetical protein [Planctomycetota bacterium]
MSDAPNASQFIEPLPAEPCLERQHKLAKQLLRAVWAKEPAATERFHALHPKPPAADEAKLADAQLVIARGYGFPAWAEMKRKIESLTQTPVERFVAAVKATDIAAVRELLQQHADVRAAVNEPLFSFGGRAIHQVGHHTGLFDLLVEFGADPNATSDWKPGGFTLLDSLDPGMVDAYLRRGVKMTIHAATRHNRLDDMKRLLEADPSLATLRGGDGQHPLHVARSVEAIDLLIAHGADVHARDIDHTATPAQYLADRPELCRRLLEHGAEPDLFMAAALGDVELARWCIAQDPACVTHRLGVAPWVNDEGGHIYNWVLGHATTPLTVASDLGHTAVHRVILAACPPKQKLLDAAWRGDLDTGRALLARHPDLLDQMTEDDHAALNRACWWYRPQTVTTMLALGFDRHIQDHERMTPLDRAAFHAACLAQLLDGDPAPPLEWQHQYGGTPLQTCIHGAMHGWPTGFEQDHARCTELLIKAGSAAQMAWLPTGDDAVDAVLLKKLRDSRNP